jgi:glycerol kinase
LLPKPLDRLQIATEAEPVAGYVLALDQGTSSSRAIVFDADANEVASASQEFPQRYPQPGWVEHDPLDVWKSQLDTAKEALARAMIQPSDIAAIGITNQRETTLIWDRQTGQAIHNAIVWQDRRTAPLCDELKAAGLEDQVRRVTGLVIDPYFSATKIRWLLDNVPEARRWAEAGELAFGTVDTWLIWNLTGSRIHATDRSNASRVMLYNLVDERWDQRLAGLLDVPASLLPEVLPSSGHFGETLADIFGVPIPISGVAGDQQAALFGQACFDPGEAKNTYGTGSFALLHTGDQPSFTTGGLLTTAAAGVGSENCYALEGSIFVTGSAVQWLRDGLGIIKTAADVEGLAGTVTNSDGVFVVPAFTGLGAPYWDPYARGAIVGLTRGSTGAHIARATLEAIAFLVCDVIDLMEEESGVELRELRVDGGAAANDLLLQIQADYLGKPVVRPRNLETTALGAAYLAGLAAGVWQDKTELKAKWHVDRRFEPAISDADRTRRRADWQRAVERSRRWAAE